jgi:hypothetical protein
LSDIIPTKNNNKKITKPLNNDNLNSENLNEFFTTVASDKMKQLISNDLNDSSLKVDVLSDETFSLPVVDNEMIESRIMKMFSKKSKGID